MGRSIGLDVHRDFCQVAIADRGAGALGRADRDVAGGAWSCSRRASAPTDRVVMEATGNALAIARILEPHVAEVVLAHAKQVRAISHARVKTDKVDAKVLADLLAAGLIPKVWIGDERIRMMRRLVSRRRGLVKRRTQIKNEIAAALSRNLRGRPPATTCSASKGRAWLAEQLLPIDERLTVDGVPAPAGLPRRRAGADRPGASPSRRSRDDDVRRLMTIPGIDAVTAVDAGRGDRRHPPLPDARGIWSATSGCTRRSASPATAPRVTAACPRRAQPRLATCSSKPPGRRRRAQGRCAPSRSAPPPDAAGTSQPSPSRASSPCSPGICSPAARTTRSRVPASSAARSAALELTAGAPRAKPGPNPDPVWNTTTEEAEKRFAAQAEAAYRRLVSDWQATGPKSGCGRDTGARIIKALEGQGRAAGHKLLTPALRHVSHPHPTAASHKELERASKFDFHP